MALAAELLLTGVSASKQLSREGSVLCEMCKKAEKRYKCPGCSIQTCSVECCKLHKMKLGCDGRRDETAFKLLNQFDDNALLSDYLFLEKASRMVNSTHRGFRKFSLDVRSEWVSKLVRACSRRCINLRVVSPNMSRGFQNKTCFLARRDVIMWQIEWLFPAINRKYIQTSVFEYDRVPNALFNLITTNNTAAPVLRPYKLHYSLKAVNVEESETKEEKSDRAEYECALKFVLRVKPNRHCFDRWQLIENEKTLASNLRTQCIVEHPTIVVLLPNESAEPYLSQNGRVPSWIASRIATSAKSCKGKTEVSEEKEEGELSEDDSKSGEEVAKSDEISNDSEDEATCSKKTRLSTAESPKPSTSKMEPQPLSLVGYGYDSDTADDDDDA